MLEGAPAGIAEPERESGIDPESGNAAGRLPGAGRAHERARDSESERGPNKLPTGRGAE